MAVFITAPAFLLPLIGGALAMIFGLGVVFFLSRLAAGAQFRLLMRIDRQNRPMWSQSG